MITAGSPCQDVSCANTRGEGITGPRSKVIFEVFKILDQVPTVKCVLFENSSCIVRRGIELVLARIEERGWKHVWGIFPASEVGCRHERKRWFCLAYDPMFQFPVLKHTQKFSATEPVRVIPKVPIAKRCALLGNSVVPDLVHHVLVTFVEAVNNPVTPETGSMVLYSSDGPVYKPVRTTEARSAALHFRDQHGTEYVRTHWVTPRKTPAAWSVGTRLTAQSMKKLATQVVYEDQTFTSDQKEDIMTYTVSPEFVEWLMHFPVGWTES